jgi:hypothetical protein
MATLYIRKIPKDLHTAIRKRAKQNSRTISAEVLIALGHHFPTARALRKLKEYLQRLQQIHGREAEGDVPDSLQMIREDRDR